MFERVVMNTRKSKEREMGQKSNKKLAKQVSFFFFSGRTTVAFFLFKADQQRWMEAPQR